MTNSSSKLNRLAERVEAASADDQFVLLREAANLLIAPGDFGKRGRFSRFLNAEAYESAAVALVPEGYDWGAGFGVDPEDRELTGWGWCGKGEGPYRFAATPALALTAACLRAAASKARADGGEG